MKKSILLLICLCAWQYTCASHINVTGIINQLARLYGLNLQQLDNLQQLNNVNQLLENTSNDLLGQAQQQVAATTGHYGLGMLFNSNADRDAHLWSAAQWQQALQQASGGNSARLQQLMGSYSQQYPALLANQIVPDNPQHPKAQHYLRQTKTNQLALASSQFTYEQINQEVHKIQTMVDKIENTANQKAALDLNNRMLAELGYIQLELLRLQATQAQVNNLQTQTVLNGVANDSQFIQW
ncbi:MAG: hypothetical protein Tsb005_13530 [Gammaproteobacteria bacterium]